MRFDITLAASFAVLAHSLPVTETNESTRKIKGQNAEALVCTPIRVSDGPGIEHEEFSCVFGHSKVLDGNAKDHETFIRIPIRPTIRHAKSDHNTLQHEDDHNIRSLLGTLSSNSSDSFQRIVIHLNRTEATEVVEAREVTEAREAREAPEVSKAPEYVPDMSECDWHRFEPPKNASGRQYIGWGAPNIPAMNEWFNKTITNDTLGMGIIEGTGTPFAYCKVPWRFTEIIKNIFGKNERLHKCMMVNRTICSIAAHRGYCQILQLSEVPGSISKEQWQLYLLTLRGQLDQLCTTSAYPGTMRGAIGGKKRLQSWI